MTTGILDRQTHPDLDTWRKLLRRSLSAIEAVETMTGESMQIRLGGGTVLSALWGHRYSKDVDLFTRDAQLVAYLRPYLSDDIAKILGTDYEETSSSIKFRLPDGSVDIVAAADILPDAKPTVETYYGRAVEIEDPCEILAKKLFYRSVNGTIRDYVDLIEGARHIQDLASRLAMPLAGKIDAAMEVLRQISPQKFSEGLQRLRFIGKTPPVEHVRQSALTAMAAIRSAGQDRLRQHALIASKTQWSR